MLENIEHSLFDKYKQRSEDTILSLLPKDLPVYYQHNEYRYVLRICFIILNRDPLNEKALMYSVRCYKKMNDFENLSKYTRLSLLNIVKVWERTIPKR